MGPVKQKIPVDTSFPTPLGSKLTGKLGNHRTTNHALNKISEEIKTTSQPIINKSGSEINQIRKVSFEDGKIKIERTPEKIENLALSGGGPKGLVYVDFIKALDEKIGLLKNLKNISGSSAGSMMAFLLAAGVNIDEIGEHVRSSDMMKEMRGEFNSRTLSLGSGIFTAGNVVEGLKKLSTKNAVEYIKNNRRLEMPSNIDSKEWFDFTIKANNGFPEGLTFRDLKILNAIDPEKFKLLYVTGYNSSKGKKVYFDATTSPDMLCHEAVRISMALPIIVKKIKLGGDYYQDGGLGSNLPLEAFSANKDYKEVDAKKTIGLKFNSKGTTEKLEKGVEAIKTRLENREKLPSGANKINQLLKKLFRKKPMTPERKNEILEEKAWRIMTAPSRLKKTFTGPNYLDSLIYDAKKACHFHREANHIGLVDTGELSIFSFSASKEQIEAAQALAKKSGNDYGDRLLNKTFDSAEEAVKQLSIDELQLLRDNPQLYKDAQIQATTEIFSKAIKEEYRQRNLNNQQKASTSAWRSASPISNAIKV